jgi:hypothetical protein
MNLVEVVILVGAQCVSPIESGPGLTEVAKVSCAVLIRHDPQTGEIEILPRTAATDPNVIAMLVRPRNGQTAVKQDPLPVTAANDVTAKVAPAPRIVPTSAAADPESEPRSKPAVEKKQTVRAAARTHAVASRRTDACGSYRAVWFTNKEGRRRYRCVKAG